jgi:hypothetical protein
MNDRVFLATVATTGEPFNGEIVDIAILDAEGQVLVESLVCPQWWDGEADLVTPQGISAEVIRSAPPLSSIREAIREAVAGKVVILCAPMLELTPGMIELLAGATMPGWSWEESPASNEVDWRFTEPPRAIAKCRKALARWREQPCLFLEGDGRTVDPGAPGANPGDR